MHRAWYRRKLRALVDTSVSDIWLRMDERRMGTILSTAPCN